MPLDVAANMERFAWTSVKDDTGYSSSTLASLWRKYHLLPGGGQGTFGGLLAPCVHAGALETRCWHFYCVFVLLHKCPRKNWDECFRSKSGIYKAGRSIVRRDVYPVCVPVLRELTLMRHSLCLLTNLVCHVLVCAYGRARALAAVVDEVHIYFAVLVAAAQAITKMYFFGIIVVRFFFLPFLDQWLSAFLVPLFCTHGREGHTRPHREGTYGRTRGSTHGHAAPRGYMRQHQRSHQRVYTPR